MIGETLPLSEHELISVADSAVIADRVQNLSSHWPPRSAGGSTRWGRRPTSTRCGAAPYLVAARATNTLLLESFGGLWDRVLAFFRELMDEDVSLDLDRAAPGFHVFVLWGDDRSRDNPARRAHFDLH